jgi:pyruvate/2-oxoglutarate dehydrogenase complex dihydrolipoamide acyltransferase (E2) component
MAVEVLLPKLGLTMQEGTIEEWLVPAGQAVSVGEPILRLATDKVDVEVEAEAEGHLHPVVEAGATLAPGVRIAWLLAGGEELPAGDSPVTADAAASPAAPAERLLSSPNARRVGRANGVDLAAVRGTGPGGRIVSEDVEEFIAAAPAETVETALVPAAAGASPLVRRQARDLGVDLDGVRGTGPGGRVTRADVDAAAAAQPAAKPATQPAAKPAAAAAGSPALPAGEIPLTGMRGVIAARMHASLHEMAQLTHGYEVTLDAVVALREQLKAEWGAEGPAVPSLNDFVVVAAARALLEHPGLNASVEGDRIVLRRDVHVGVAVAVPDGLLVPVIRDAASRALTDVAAQTRSLAMAARDGRLPLAALEGATFVVTSLGGYGVDFFTPIVNPGNVAILGVGRLRDGVRWEGDVPHRSRVLTLSLTFDHRAVDGAPAAEFLRTVSGLLARPLHLLAGHA